MLGLVCNNGRRVRPVTPSMYKAVIDGDSLSSSQVWAWSTNYERRSYGWWTLCAALTYQMFNTRYAQSFGTSGHDIGDMLDGQATVVSYIEANGVHAVFALLGTNDVEQDDVSIETLTTSYATFIDAYLACSNSPYVFIGLPLPRGDLEGYEDEETTLYVQRLHQIRAAISGIVATRGDKCRLFDAYYDIVDLTVVDAGAGTHYYPKTGYMNADGVHFSQFGAYYVAKRAAEAVKATPLWYAPVALPTTSGAFNPNTGLAGTGGSNGTGSSGSVADNCRLNRDSGADATAVCSKETITIFGVEQMTQKIVISGGSAALEEFFFYSGYGATPETFDGTKGVELVVPIKISGGSIGLKEVAIYARETVGGVNYISIDNAYSVSTAPYFTNDDGDIELLLRTEPKPPAAGLSTTQMLLVRIALDGTVAGNTVTVNIGQFVARQSLA